MHRYRFAGLLAILLFAVAPSPVQADDQATCDDRNGPADAAIQACSRVIAAGRLM
jgi:hypothetical protein